MNIDELTKNVLSETDNIINKYGPRLAGTKASLDTADYLYNDGLNYSDSMHKENFDVHKGAFFGWINLIVFFYVLGFISFLLGYTLITIGFGVLSLIVLYFQFIRYMPLIDFLFPKKPARNVYGIIEPKDEVKQQVIISGHHDSAPIFNFFIHQPKLYGLRVTGSILLVVLGLVISVLHYFFYTYFTYYLFLGVIGLGLLLVIQMWFFKNKKLLPVREIT